MVTFDALCDSFTHKICPNTQQNDLVRQRLLRRSKSRKELFIRSGTQYGCLKMVQLEGKAVTVSIGAAFLLGFILGWKSKEMRLKYLKAKRDYLARKAQETHDKIIIA